jgi:hypothetical protein
MTPIKIRRKGPFLEAVRYDGTNIRDIDAWAGVPPDAVYCPLDVGDWIVRDEDGDYMHCEGLAFHQLYEEVKDDGQTA